MKTITLSFLVLFSAPLLLAQDLTAPYYGADMAPTVICGTDYGICGTGLIGYPAYDPTYETASWTLTGLNAASIGWSSYQLISGKDHTVPYYCGVVTGTAQCAMGAVRLMRAEKSSFPSFSNTERAYMNLGVGFLSLAINTWGLIRANERRVKRSYSLNAFAYPNQQQSYNFGVSFTKRLK